MHTASSEYAQPRTSTYFLTVKKGVGKKKGFRNVPLLPVFIQAVFLSLQIWRTEPGIPAQGTPVK